MPVSAQDQALHASVKNEVAATAVFLKRYLSGRKESDQIAAFDSAVHQGNELVLDNYPTCLQSIFDSAFGQHVNAKLRILEGIEYGIAEYGRRHGGDAPSAELVAAGISCGAAILNRNTVEGKALFDNIQRSIGINLDDQAQFDSLTYGHSEALSMVPALVMVTISNRISSGIPTIAYLPNLAGTNELPLLYGRPTASKDWGALAAGDYLDGAKATSQYFGNHWQFAMTPGTGGTALVYTVTPRTHYLDAAALTPDTGADVAPFVAGRIRILVNGVEVAHDRYKAHPTKTGTSTLVGVDGVVIDSTAVKVDSGSAVLSTGLITATFHEALPAGAVVTAEVVFDFERKGSDGKALITPPGIDIELSGASLYATPMRALVTATIDSITQMRNELGIDPRAAAMGMVQGKFYLEETLRLLKACKQRAVHAGRSFAFDASRGVSSHGAAVYNTSGELMSEVRNALNQAKQSIAMATNSSPAGFDLYVGNNGAILFSRLTSNDGYSAVSGFTYGTDAITRIGQFEDGINVYHVPGNASLLTESSTAAQFMLVARASDPAKAAIVGHVAVPPMMLEYNADPFEQGAGVYARVAGELNPIDRFADQSAIIRATNLPTLA